MMAAQIDCTFADGRPVEALTNLLKARTKYLGNTAYKAVIGTSIDVLNSVKQSTRVMRNNPHILAEKYNVDIRPSQYIASWKMYKNANRRARRCVRTSPNGPELLKTGIAQHPIVNLAPDYFPGEENVVKVWELRIYSKAANNNKPWLDRAVISTGVGRIKKYAEQKIKNHARAARKLSQTVIGLAQHKIAGTPTNKPAKMAKRIAAMTDKFVDTKETIRKTDKGGVFTVNVIDSVNSALVALKNGKASIDLAFMKAANKIAGRIQHSCKDLLEPGEIETPFPEITRKAAK